MKTVFGPSGMAGDGGGRPAVVPGPPVVGGVDATDVEDDEPDGFSGIEVVDEDATVAVVGAAVAVVAAPVCVEVPDDPQAASPRAAATTATARAGAPHRIAGGVARRTRLVRGLTAQP